MSAYREMVRPVLGPERCVCHQPKKPWIIVDGGVWGSVACARCARLLPKHMQASGADAGCRECDDEFVRMRLADAEEELATALADNAGLMRETELLRAEVESWQNAAYTLNDKLYARDRRDGGAL